MVSRFLMVRRINNGAFGEVWEGFDQFTAKKVAIKFLRRGDALESFQREARILYEQINNPFVVRFIAANMAVNPPYLVLEYCEFGSLDSWIGTGRDWREIAVVLNHALAGLAAIHAIGGFHRDLKPANLLLTTTTLKGEQKLVIKVSDFGLARRPLTVSPGMTTSAAGTPGYIAPEVLTGTPFSPNADIYSLGITGIELLTGSKDARSLAGANAPPEFIAILESMVRAAPDSRPDGPSIAQRLKKVLDEDKRIVEMLKQIKAAKQAAAENKPAEIGLGKILLGGLAVALGLAALGGLGEGD